MNVTNLEVGYYHNKLPGSRIHISTVLKSYFGSWVATYIIEEKIDDINNFVLNSTLLL